MANDSVDRRKLKDEATELLKKGKLEKAVEVLETLARAEPKDMSHRLRLGDAYRRLDKPLEAIQSYQHAARFFGDEGQLIKGIAAVKLILEIEPRNMEARRRLAEMNERRFGRPPPERGAAKIARLAVEARAVPKPAVEDFQAFAGPELPLEAGDDDEPLELDDGRPSPRRDVAAGMPRRGLDPGTGALVPPPPDPGRALELEDRSQITAELEEAEVVGAEEAEPEHLPDDAILTPEAEAEDLASSPNDEEIAADLSQPLPVMDDAMIARARAAAAARAANKPAAAPPRSGSRITVSDEIVVEDEPVGKGGRPIADLLSSDGEEEIELLSPAARPSKTDPEEEEDFDRMLGTLAPDASRRRSLPVRKVLLFDDLDQSTFVELVHRLGYHRHAAGDVILREGDPGRSFFIIVDGKVRVVKAGPGGEEIDLAELGEGAFFGEMALLSGAPRTASVVAERDTELLEVTDSVLRELAQSHPQVVTSLKNFYRQRLLANVMTFSPLFKEFEPADRKSIVERFRMRQASPGDVVIAEGSPSDGLYVVLHGSVAVTVQKGQESVEVARLREGDVFGEMSLVTREPASATVTSGGNSILLRLPRESFQELAVTHPQILALVSELTEERRSATEAVRTGKAPGGRRRFV